MKEQYLTLKQVAILAGNSYGAVRREIENGRLHAYRVGRKYLVDVNDAADYAEQHRQPTDGYTIKEIMEILPLSYAFLINLVRSGKLPAVKCGRHYIIPKQALNQFIADSKLQGQNVVISEES